MKKITLLLSLFILLSDFVFAQDSLRAYYATVAKAEWAVCENNLSQAASLYKTAFTYKSKPFQVDIRMALDCELQLDVLDTVTCEHYFTQIVLERSWGLIEKEYNDYFINTHKSGRLGSNFEKLIEQYFSMETNALQKQIQQMQEDDQRVRFESQGWLDTCADGNLCDKKIVCVDSVNNIKLLELLKTNPEILDENVVGMSCISYIGTLLNHQRGHDFLAHPYLLEATKKGIFDARKYAKIFDVFYQFGYENDTAKQEGVFEGDYYGTFNLYNFFDSENNKSMSVIFTDERNRRVKNSHRSEIFLEDILDFSYRTFCRQDLPGFRKGYRERFEIPESALDGLLDFYKRSNIQFDYFIPNEKDFDFKRAE